MLSGRMTGSGGCNGSQPDVLRDKFAWLQVPQSSAFAQRLTWRPRTDRRAGRLQGANFSLDLAERAEAVNLLFTP